jgi:hypothetical protein
MMQVTTFGGYQARIAKWMQECFGPTIAADKEERNNRFLEEALELVQSLGMTRSVAHQLVEYTYGRPLGDPIQEIGGVQVTLFALASASQLSVERASQLEADRIEQPHVMQRIREKQFNKPKFSPLAELRIYASPDSIEQPITDAELDDADVKILEDHGLRGKVYEVRLRANPDSLEFPITSEHFSMLLRKACPNIKFRGSTKSTYWAEFTITELMAICKAYYNTVISRSESESHCEAEPDVFNEGFVGAFYRIAEALDITGPRPNSPAEILETMILPKIKELMEKSQ